MLNQIRWHQANADLNPLSHLNFIRWYVHWSNGRRMDNYIGNLLDKRYSEIRKEIAEGAGLKTKSVIDLILQAYATTSSEGQPPIALDSEFRIFAIRQIRLFVFVGHDSTSSTICYIIHLLFGHPEILGKVRSEVAKVFGIAEEIPSKITEQQHLLNHLPYTTAVIKEAMRLFPAAAASRQGQPGYSIIDDSGQSCPTDECFVLTVHLALQRSAKYWPKPDDFIPERFLVEPGHELYPPKNGWRPFEKGPRNCMAEGLVMLELKVVLAIVLSCFDFVEAYEEYDRVQGKKGKTYKGERAYQIEEGAAHPVDGYPCKVSIRGRHGS